MIYLSQCVDDLLQALMEDISPLVPTPIIEQILVYWAFFDEDMLS